MKIAFSTNIYIYIMSYIIFPLIVLYGIRLKKENNILKKRNTDMLRGLSIIMIVLHHFSIRMGNPGIMKLFFYFGYLGVGLFFFISGYGLMSSYLNKNDYLHGFIKKKILRLYIPFFIANLFFIILNIVVFRKSYTMPKIFISFVTLHSIDAVILWYVIVTMFLYLAFYLCFKFLDVSKSIKLLFIGGLIYIIVGRYFKAGTYWYNTVLCFPLGIYIANNKDKILNYIKNSYKSVMIGSIFIFVITFGVYFKRNYVILAIISSMFFITTIFLITYKLELNSKSLIFIGGISYEIYIVHEAIYYPFYRSINISRLPYSIYFYLALVVIASFILHKVVKKINLKK